MESPDSLLKGDNGPIVRDVEVLLKRVDLTNLQNVADIASKYGFRFGKDADAKDTLMLDASKWEAKEASDGSSTITFGFKGNEGITLETSLVSQDNGDQATIVLMQQVSDRNV